MLASGRGGSSTGIGQQRRLHRTRTPIGAVKAIEPRLLAPLGVTAFDERIYRSLLAAPALTRGQLADQVGERAERVAPSLRRLADLGFVSRLAGHPRRYVPAMPEVAVESVVHSRQHELLQALTAISELSAEYRSGRRDDPGALVEVLTGEAAVAQRFTELQRSCREELLLCDRPPYAAPADNPEQSSVLSRGVRWRTIYSSDSLARPGAPEHLDSLIAQGEEARLLPDLPMKLLIVDRRVAVLPLTLDADMQQSAVIHRSTLLDAMVTLFDVFWNRAMPLHAPEQPEMDGLDPDDRQLLSLLVTGVKDEAIARELGVGVRTLRRRMHRLLETLGAETRFQAGMQAKSRGWLG